MNTRNLTALFELEIALLQPTGLCDEIDFENKSRLQQLDRAARAVREIRGAAYSIIDEDDVTEYYAMLLLFAAKMMTRSGLSSSQDKRTAVQQRHALFSAAMICQKILKQAKEGQEKEKPGEAKQPAKRRIKR